MCHSSTVNTNTHTHTSIGLTHWNLVFLIRYINVCFFFHTLAFRCVIRIKSQSMTECLIFTQCRCVYVCIRLRDKNNTIQFVEENERNICICILFARHDDRRRETGHRVLCVAFVHMYIQLSTDTLISLPCRFVCTRLSSGSNSNKTQQQHRILWKRKRKKREKKGTNNHSEAETIKISILFHQQRQSTRQPEPLYSFKHTDTGTARECGFLCECVCVWAGIGATLLCKWLLGFLFVVK